MVNIVIIKPTKHQHNSMLALAFCQVRLCRPASMTTDSCSFCIKSIVLDAWFKRYQLSFIPFHFEFTPAQDCMVERGNCLRKTLKCFLYTVHLGMGFCNTIINFESHFQSRLPPNIIWGLAAEFPDRLCPRCPSCRLALLCSVWWKHRSVLEFLWRSCV